MTINPPRYVSVKQMQHALRHIGLAMIGVRPSGGIAGVTLWRHKNRPNEEFTLSDPDYKAGARLMYTYELAIEIFARARMFVNGQPDLSEGMKFHLDGKPPKPDA
jgi:hypothetical protein